MNESYFQTLTPREKYRTVSLGKCKACSRKAIAKIKTFYPLDEFMKRHPAAWELYLSQCIATGKKPATIQLYSDPLRRNATPHLKNLEIDVCDLHEKEATKLLCAQPDFIIVEINRGPSENDAKSVSASTFLH